MTTTNSSVPQSLDRQALDLLKDFRHEFQERLLDLLWRQWITFGVAGQSAPQERAVIDPEALLLISCTIARSDPRLFDAILEWLRMNGRYINIHRLQRMLSEYSFAGGSVYAAIADSISTSVQAAKWARSARQTTMGADREEPLFLMENGEPLPIVREPSPVFRAHGFLRDPYEPRGVVLPFRPELHANLILRLRAFLGVSARCEILAYLLHNGRGSPRAIARACGYYPATVSKALSEMADSGYVGSRIEGRHRYYELASDAWRNLLVGKERPSWIGWAPLFRAFEETWLFLHEHEREGQSQLAQASDLRRLLKASLMDRIMAGGLPLAFGDYDRASGEALIPFFVSCVRKVFEAIDELG